MNAQHQSWEDLRLVLAIVKGKGLSGASRRLGTHHTTVLRRLDSLEQRSGVRLFHRLATGYEPTDLGEELARIAEGIEQDVLGAYRQLAGMDLRLSGTIRCATADYLALGVLPPVLQDFRSRYPDIDIEVAISAQFASLTKRDADVALRAANVQPELLVGTRVTEIAFGIYASKSYMRDIGTHADLDDLDWIGEDDTLRHSSTNQWRSERFPHARVRMKFDSLLGKAGAVKGDLGVAFLPHFLARSDRKLVCLETNPGQWTLGLWLLTHPDLARMYRVKAFLKCAEESLRKLHWDA